MRMYSLILLATIAIILWATFGYGQIVSTDAGNATAEDSVNSMFGSTGMSATIDGNLTMPNGTLNGNDIFWTTVPDTVSLDGMLLPNSTAVFEDEFNSSIAPHLEYHLNVKGPIGKDAANNRLKMENADEGDRRNETMADLARQKFDGHKILLGGWAFTWNLIFKNVNDTIKFKRDGKLNTLSAYNKIVGFMEKIYAIKAVKNEADKVFIESTFLLIDVIKSGEMRNQTELALSELKNAYKVISTNAEAAFDTFNKEFEEFREEFNVPLAML